MSSCGAHAEPILGHAKLVNRRDCNPLSEQQLAGLENFVEGLLHPCHTGAYVGGSQYKCMGAIGMPTRLESGSSTLAIDSNQ